METNTIASSDNHTHLMFKGLIVNLYSAFIFVNREITVSAKIAKTYALARFHGRKAGFENSLRSFLLVQSLSHVMKKQLYSIALRRVLNNSKVI